MSTTTAPVTESDLRALVEKLAEIWKSAEVDHGRSPRIYGLAKVSGTARYDHWAVTVRSDEDAPVSYVQGFDNLGSLRQSHATLRAALVAANMATRLF